MYLTYYNIEIKPFESSPDPRFIWLGEKHKEALAILKYGIQESKEFILLTGDVGTGKTTLINCFLDENDTDAIITSIPDPDLTIENFFKLLSNEFGIDIDFETRGEFLLKFKEFLDHTYSDQRKVLLIIDEAQRLNPRLLEQIRLLSNIERHDAKLLSIFLIGQNELHQCLMDEQNRALHQRIAVHCHLEALTEAETRDYINHRLQVAGSIEEIFSPEAILEIFSFSKGCPRLINTICDRALLSGYAESISRINRKIVQQSAAELVLPGERDGNPEKPDIEVRKENKHLSAGETQAGMDNNLDQDADAPVPEAGTEPSREAVAGAPEAEADQDPHHGAPQQKPETIANEPVVFTWGPGAESKPLWVSVNDQKLLSRDKSTLSPRTIMVAAAILTITAVVLYLWLGVGS